MSLNESFKAGVAALVLAVAPTCGDSATIVDPACIDTNCDAYPDTNCDTPMDDYRETLRRCLDGSNDDIGFGRGHNDPEHCIDFVVPDDWTVGTDEGGQLYAYRQNPYLSIDFNKLNDKESWQEQMRYLQGLCYSNSTTTEPASYETLISETDTIVAGYSATYLIFATKGGFQYGVFFVDAGDEWYEFRVSDPSSPEIAGIIQSLKLP